MKDILKGQLDKLKALRRDLKGESGARIGKKVLWQRAEQLGTFWFDSIAPTLGKGPGFSPEILEKYSKLFERLIRISRPNTSKKIYIETLDAAIGTFREDFIIPVQRGKLTETKASSFDSFFASIVNPDESEYLKEAIACARAGYYRAAVVLGWSATIDRIQRRIEKTGFRSFNVISAQMASQQTGRFKKFNQIQNVNSLNELRQVFDTIVLWIIEGMGFIDSNQHTRLRSCFDMRCQGAHPGDAPISQYNLLSFFSDIEQIILSNPKFNLTD